MSDSEPESILPTKAYKNLDFVNSREARTLRVVCEFEETLQRLRANHVKETILVFGSHLAMTRKQYNRKVAEARQRVEAAQTPEEKEYAQDALEAVTSREWMCEKVEQIKELSRRLTEWAMTYKSLMVVGKGHLTAEDSDSDDDSHHKQSLMICTGGSGGFQEAANHGAALVPEAKNIAMGISLPGNVGVTGHATQELAFEYHYFFTRKYWMMYPCRALIVPPGGFATLDVLFELLTLKQTGKIKIDIPVVLFGRAYWEEVINFQALMEYGTISVADYESLFFTDDVEEAFNYITSRILQLQDKDREVFYSSLHK